MLAKKVTIPTSGTPSAKGSFRYPNVAYESDSDYVQFTFYDYSAPFSKQSQAAAAGSLFGLNEYNASSSGLGGAKATVLLYMPEDIENQYGAGWQDTNLSNMAKGALGSFGNAAGGDFGKAIKNVADTLGQATENAITKGTLITNIISDALQRANFASLTVNDIFGSTTNQILNPNTEVLYKGPMMRNFSLDFKMAPKNVKEAIEIKNIIHVFKAATLPRFGGAGDATNASFVKVPQIVDVTFKTGSTDNPWVSQYKPSVIKSFDVSYTPDGAWATYGDGSPVATSIKISFQETKMVYADELSSQGASY